MRLAYLDASAGISGDMLLGAFIHAGVSVDLLHETLARLNVGATLRVEEVDRSGLHAMKAHVLVGEKSSGHHAHHGEHRSLDTIRELIAKAKLPQPVETRALRAFELLGEAEAKIHHVPIEKIHFHEVGAADAIADIVLASASAHALGIKGWSCSPLNVGGGTVECAHGRFPVPAPATAELLRGAPTYSSGLEAELVTPTGAALVRAFDCTFGPAPHMIVTAIGHGAGTQNPPGFANVARLSIGEAQEQSSAAETVLVMEVAVDDLNPQIIAYVTEQALKLGALDVMCAPVFMKKNRPGTLITVLSDRGHAQDLENLLLRETSTLGLRIHEERRVCLQRKHVEVITEWGPVRIKIGHRGEHEMNAAPEFDDCRVSRRIAHGPGQARSRGRAAGLSPGASMNPELLLKLLTQIQQGQVTPEEGVVRLADLPYEDLEFAKIDHHRALRTGMPEVIYGAGKTDRQIVEIFERMARQGGNVLATRVAESAAAAVVAAHPTAIHNIAARTVSLRQQDQPSLPGTIAILCAGTSDLPVAEEAAVTAEILGNKIARIYDVGVAGLHRLLAHRSALAEARVIIACAGMEGALPSVVAGLVSAPVIAVPTSVGYGASFGGMTALLGMLNSCSPNIGVVNIDNGFGAACLAHSILNTRARK